jgi:D-aminoacyl-tRNA deacylase
VVDFPILTAEDAGDAEHTRRVRPPGRHGIACRLRMFGWYNRDTMRAVIQRVTEASVEVSDEVVGEIGAGFLVLLGVARDDANADADYLAEKIVNLRVFDDDEGKMNRSLLETGGAMLVVSQFTLYGDVRRGRRPSYSDAAEPEKANRLYEYFVERVRSLGVKVETGVFQAMMKVSLQNDGPVTILIDSRRAF